MTQCEIIFKDLRENPITICCSKEKGEIILAYILSLKK